MAFARSAGMPRRRPALLALVFGFVLVLVGITASALVAIASAHISTPTLSGAASRDASLVELFVNDHLRATDLAADTLTRERRSELSALLDGLTAQDGILRIEIRDPTGFVLVSDDPSVIGERVPLSESARTALEGRGDADLVTDPALVEAAGDGLGASELVQEYLPIVDADDRAIAVVALWRDAGAVLETVEAARRDVMLVTLAAGLLLALMLFLIFRSAQTRLSRQHAQLAEAARRDARTEMLNHGAIVALLADEVEAARGSARGIGVALVDIDGFRLFNDTHGHDAADEVLLRVAEIVAAEPDGAHVARYGPDEFLIVRPGAGLAAIDDAASRVRHALEAVTVQFGDSDRLPVTVSIGLCTYPEHGDSVTELLSSAAVAVGEAKSSGGNTVRVAEVEDPDRVVSGSFDVLHGLVIAVDTKDRYTKRHSEDVARYAVFLAERMGVDEETRRTIHMAGLLHDVGKIGIPDNVLRKPSKLTADEFGMFQQHVALGEAIVRDLPNVELVRAGIRHHHERWDGRGYLDNLEGEEIPLVGRILAVADAFSAMTTTRPYRKALPIEEALKRLGDAAGTQLQEELVAAFIEGIETAEDAPLPGEEPTSIWRLERWVA